MRDAYRLWQCFLIPKLRKSTPASPERGCCLKKETGLEPLHCFFAGDSACRIHTLPQIPLPGCCIFLPPRCIRGRGSLGKCCASVHAHTKRRFLQIDAACKQEERRGSPGAEKHVLSFYSNRHLVSTVGREAAVNGSLCTRGFPYD